jgi:hypothetical protein
VDQNDAIEEEAPRDPGDLSLREALQLASRLKVKAWLWLVGGVVAVLSATFTAGSWWEKHFGDNDSRQVTEVTSTAASPQGSTRENSIDATEPRFLADRRDSRTRQAVTRLESTLNELPWEAIPPGRFGFMVTAPLDAEISKALTSCGYDDDARNDHWLEIHKLGKDEYVALGYLSQADSRDVALARVPAVVRLYTIPNEEAPVFVDNLPLDRFHIVRNRTVGEHQGQVFDLTPLKAEPTLKRHH